MRLLIVFIVVYLFVVVESPALAQGGVFHTHIDSTETILPLLNQFNQDARKHNLYVGGKISKHLGGVRVVNESVMEKLYRPTDTIPLGLLKREVNRGLYGFVYLQPMVYIQKDIISNPTLLKWVLYHELGHFLGLGHSNGIMSKSVPLNLTLTEEDWDVLLFKLFSDIGAIQPNNRWIKSDNTYE